jgi:hypothetical protein
MRPVSTLLERICITLATILFVGCSPQSGFAWGPEGHEVIALIAEHYMTPAAKAKATEILDGSSPESVASWADEYRTHHREPGPWHYIDIPLADSQIDMARECPNGDCVIAKTEQFLVVLRDSHADRAAKAEALKFVVHFIGDMHQPLHVTDNGDKGGNGRYVVFERHLDNLHWVWDTGLLGHINRNPNALAAELENRVTSQERVQWTHGSIEEWVLEGHRLAQSVVYEALGNGDPVRITPEYEHQADRVIEIQLEKAGVRLAYLLDADLVLDAAEQKPETKGHSTPHTGNPETRVWVNANSGVYHCPGTKW